MTTLSHTTAREYIQQMADGEALRVDARQALQHHLAECAECRAYAQEIKALHQTLARTLRSRWEQQPVPSHSWPPVTRPAARPWSPLAQVMVMVTMTIMVLSLLPEWGRLPTSPLTPEPTPLDGTDAAATTAPTVLERLIESGPDEALESLTRHEAGPVPDRLESTDEDKPRVVYPYYMNDPDRRASRAQ